MVVPGNRKRGSISFDVATDGGASRPRNCGSILDCGSNFLSSPESPVHLWEPAQLPMQWIQRTCSR